MKNKVFYSTVCTLILLMGIVLFYQNYQLKKELQYSHKILDLSNSSKLSKIKISHLRQILNKYLLRDLEVADSKWNLVIIYSPEDCPKCLEEVSFWENFRKKQKNFECWGLINHPYEELVIRFVNSMGWNFQNRVIKENIFGENFGLGKTPLKVLLNDRNQIYFVEGPLPTWDQEGKLIQLIGELFSNVK